MSRRAHPHRGADPFWSVTADHASDAPTALGPLERRALNQVRRHGIVGFTVRMGSLSVVASLVMVLVCLLVLDGFSGPSAFWWPALAIGAIVPATVAPPMYLYCGRLIARLDATATLLRASAVTDPLTGVANRRGFFAALEQAEGDVEVAMVDVDEFKSLNDRFGHACGDAALVAVAEWLPDLVGEVGIVGRLGGDEFAYLAPPHPSRVTPSRHRFELGDAAFTVSVGVARSGSEGAEQALLAADAQLYRQKQLAAGPASTPT